MTRFLTSYKRAPLDRHDEDGRWDVHVGNAVHEALKAMPEGSTVRGVSHDVVWFLDGWALVSVVVCYEDRQEGA